MSLHHHHHHEEERVHTEAAVLDIGEDIGALIIYTNPDLRGHEIEVSLKGNTARRVHTAVLERKVNESSVFAALYMSLEAGDYIVWKNDTEPGGEITIVGGEIAQIDWR